MNEYDRVLELIRKYIPGFAPDIVVKETKIAAKFWTIHLPVPPKADYAFVLYLYEDGERQIGARLVGSSDEQFWYLALELAGFRDDVKKLEAEFLRIVELLLTCETLIRRKRGVMWESFTCCAKTGEKWKRLGWYSGLGLGLGIPFFGRVRVFSSPAVVDAAR